MQTACLFPAESRFKCMCAGPEKGGLRKGKKGVLAEVGLREKWNSHDVKADMKATWGEGGQQERVGEVEWG